jgi:putative oxidoreductase
MMPDLFAVFARLLLTGLFFVSAAGKFINVDGVTNTFSARGIPQPMLSGYLFAAIELIGALSVLLGYRARWGAGVLLLLTAATILISHNFWDMEGLERIRSQTHALKNLAIMGGLLLLAARGPGRFAVNARS